MFLNYLFYITIQMILQHLVNDFQVAYKTDSKSNRIQLNSWKVKFRTVLIKDLANIVNYF